MATADEAVSAAEAKTLFDPLADASALVLAVSGGADSTALMVLAARWRRARRSGPRLLAVTVDHGLRRESAAEASTVKRLARRLGVLHRIVRWQGKKPASGLQRAARLARYRLLAEAAKAAKADVVVTAHTLDDQAETVLIRMSRGSGIAGLSAMPRVSALPVSGARGIILVRPLLEIPKARLIATLELAKIEFVDDPSNRDPRFTRARLRGLMPALAREGLTTRRLALLAKRLRRAEAAIEAAVDCAVEALSERPWPERGPIVLAAGKFACLPAEVALRVLGHAIAQAGDEGPVELGKLETLYQALATANASGNRPLRRTLAGALVTLEGNSLVVERAPARRSRTGSS
ncbi:MAG: tRNA lysidine(34) synthetase TilS [Xanthobacteraceae bacterium]